MGCGNFVVCYGCEIITLSILLVSIFINFFHKTLRKKINSVFSRTTRGERIQRSCLRDHFKHLTAFYVNICFIAQYTKIHDTYRFLLFVFLIFFSLNFLPTAHPLLKQNSNMNTFRWSERNTITINNAWV